MLRNNNYFKLFNMVSSSRIFYRFPFFFLILFSFFLFCFGSLGQGWAEPCLSWTSPVLGRPNHRERNCSLKHQIDFGSKFKNIKKFEIYIN